MTTQKMPNEEQAKPKSRRGFAAMSPERQKAIAAKGGRMAHRLGRGHIWNREEAIEAGRRGGKASRGGRGKKPQE